jgi:hypothetical protein
MGRVNDKYEKITEIINPVILNEGINTIYIRTACFDSTDGTKVPEKIISSPAPVRIELDKSKARYDISYDKTYRTKETVTGTLEIYNDNPSKTYTVKSQTTGIVVENTADSDIFTLKIEKSVNGTISILDNLGNLTDNINVKVDWIDKDAPLASVSSNTVENAGERRDGTLVVKVEGAVKDVTRFALLEKKDNNLREDNFEKFSLMESNGHIKVSSIVENIKNKEVNQTYTIRIMGLSGEYKLGYSSEDTLGKNNRQL